MSLASKLTEERRARLAAERLLELKQAELSAANRKLGKHAQKLTMEIVETRAKVASMQGENQRVKSDLTEAKHKIELKERQLWHSIETIQDGFAFFNADQELLMANHAFLKPFDGLEEIRPGVNYVTILQLMTDEGVVDTGGVPADEWRQRMLERFSQPVPEAEVIKLWNGNYIRLFDRRGPGGDVVSLALDITQTVHDQKNLKEARSAAESANRAKSAFLANMTHEIRTPMNGVIGMADLLLETVLDTEQQKYAETIKNSAEALLVIINDVLDYSKIEAERLSLQTEAFNLEAAVKEVLMILTPSASEKGIELILDYDQSLPRRMISDAGRIRQILTNLIGNAVKFTAQGHVKVAVTGQIDPAKRALRLRTTVEDTGIGIPADMLDHIFGEFNQVEDERNRNFEGTGLGLAISERLVQMLGGRIWVTSEQGEGACFGFEVPCDLPEEDETDAARTSPQDTERKPEPDTRKSRQMRVLAAEDNRTNRLVFEKMVKGLNIDLAFATNGEEAIAKVQTFEPDLVFMDISMPKIDGKEATRTIRKTEKDTHIPIVALTAHALQGDQSDILEAGLDTYLTKPFKKELIIAEIERAHGPGMAPLQLDQEEG